MEVLNYRELSTLQKRQVLKLWNNEFPEKLAFNDLADFQIYLDNLKDKRHSIILDDSKKILAWIMDFRREGQTNFSILIDSAKQRKGLGSILINHSKERNDQLQGWVVQSKNEKRKDGSLYISPTEFYLKRGFQILEEEKLSFKGLETTKIIWKPTF